MLLAQVPPLETADIDPTVAAKLLLQGLETRNWWLVAGPVVALAVWFLRVRLAPTVPALDNWLKQPVPALLSPVLVSFLGGVLTLAAAGTLTPEALMLLVPVVLKVAFTAISTFVGTKKVAEQKAQAQQTATEKVVTLQDAAKVLSEPVVPPAQDTPK